MSKRFKKDRNGAATFTTVMNTAEQLDAIVHSVPLGTRLDDQWQQIRLEIHQLAAAYNIPQSFPERSPNSAASSTLAATYSTQAAAAAIASPSPLGHTWLRISAFANVPLAGADVAVYDTRGKRIFQKNDATNDRGVYPARIDKLPRDFRVTVALGGASLQDADLRSAGAFTLMADVRNFDPTTGVVYVNPVTTLVSRLLDQDRRMNIEQARATVRHFLGLPVGANLGAAMRQDSGYHSPYFSETAFLEQALQHGGMGRFLSDLTPLMLTPSSPTRSFVGPPRVAAVAAVAKFVGTNLAAAAIWFGAGEGFGWVMAQAGLTTPGATAAQIKDVQDKLADLQSSVANLSSQLQALTEEVRAKLTTIQRDLINVRALPLASNINEVERDLSFYADGCPPLVPGASASDTHRFADYCVDEKADLRVRLNNNAASFEELSVLLLDNHDADFDGLIHLYSQSLGESVRFFKPSDSTKVENMYSYWNAVEVQAANLKVERMHLNGFQDNSGGIKNLHDFLGDVAANPPVMGRFQNTVAEEDKLMFPAVPLNIVINTKDHTMWLTGIPNEEVTNCGYPRPGSATDRPFPDYVEVQTYYGKEFEYRSPTLAEAKALIQGWTGTSPSKWLADQTRYKPPVYLANGFVDVAEWPACTNRGIATIWTRDSTGNIYHSPLGSKDYPINYTLNLVTGEVTDPKLPQGAVGDPYNNNWNFMMRELKPGEQYYWYSNR